MRHRTGTRRVFAWISDTHAGKKTGLLNPATVLVRVHEDGSEEKWRPGLSPLQRWFWPVYMTAIGELAEYASGDETVVAHAGDITQGDKYDTLIPETTISDQRTIAIYNMVPLLKLPNVKRARFLTGTELHVPDAAEVRIASELRMAGGLDIQTCHHRRFRMGHDWVDGAHHGPYAGSRDWLRGNVALYYLKDRIYLDRRGGVEPAVAYMRGHFHQHVRVPVYDDWNGNARTRYVIIVPSFCGPDNYVRKIAKSPPIIEAGIVALEFIDGYLTDVVAFTDKKDLRTEEVL